MGKERDGGDSHIYRETRIVGDVYAIPRFDTVGRL